MIDPPPVPSKKDIRICLRPTIGAIAREASRLAVGQKSLFFCQSRALTEAIAEHMRGRGIDVFVHHSSVAFEGRTAAEERFQRGTNTSLICTSTLELGIDVGDLDLVFQANAPATVASFLQRLGRAGRRAGQRANTTFFCEDPETVLQAIALVELARQGWVESIPPHTRCWPVLVHQLLALTLQFGALSQEQCWASLSVVPDFSGISREEFDVLLTHLIAEGFVVVLQRPALRGRYDRADLRAQAFSGAVCRFFESATLHDPDSDGSMIGSLEQAFVDRLSDEWSAFLLGGQAWMVVQVNHHERTVVVALAPHGTIPSWSGFAPQLLSVEVCQQIAALLTSEGSLPYLDRASQEALAVFKNTSLVPSCVALMHTSRWGQTRDSGDLSKWSGSIRRSRFACRLPT